MATPRNLILFRTHYFDSYLETIADELVRETGIPLCFVIDERRGAVEIPERFFKVSHTNEELERIGLFTEVDNLFWRCGDYVFYNAYHHFPDYDFYWTIEPDIYLNFENKSEFFDFFNEFDLVDCLALGLGEANPDWGLNYDGMHQFSERVYRCIYPIMRLSRGAVDFLSRERVALSARYLADGYQPFRWPNDESFTATMLMENGYSVRDFNDFGREFYRGEHMWGGPYAHRLLKEQPADGVIYHQVFSGETYRHKIFEHLRYSQMDERMNPDFFRWRFDPDRTSRSLELEEVVNRSEVFAEFNMRFESILAEKLRVQTHDQRAALIDAVWHGADPWGDATALRTDSDLQGWNSYHGYLLDAVERVGGGIYVDLGVWKGASTVEFARIIMSKKLDSVVLAVDTFLGGWDHWLSADLVGLMNMQRGRPALYDIFVDNVLNAGLRNFVLPLPLDSHNASIVLRRCEVVVDCVHVDGANDFESVAGDMARWWGLLRDGGVMIVSDYHDDGRWPEVRAAVDQFVAERGVAGFEADGGKCRMFKPSLLRGDRVAESADGFDAGELGGGEADGEFAFDLRDDDQMRQ
jgi:hypothetical protein